jgi:dephospho-CoA kinase
MIIGITGSIATGKSVVTKYLAKKGFPIVDSDLLAQTELDRPETMDVLTQHFGEKILENQKVNRKALGAIIFGNTEERLFLNSVIHPKVIARIRELTQGNQKIVFVDVPLLYEAKMEGMFDQVIVVYASLKNQLKRLMARDHISENYALQKIKTQMDVEVKISQADHVINNNGSVKETHRQIDDILRRITK